LPKLLSGLFAFVFIFLYVAIICGYYLINQKMLSRIYAQRIVDRFHAVKL